MIKIFVRSPYNYDRNAAGDESGLACEDVSLTLQSESEACDINVIVKRFGVTGQLPVNMRRPPSFEDFRDSVVDFKTAMDLVTESTQSFAAMPADVRSRFGNDPAAFVDFCSREENLPEMRRLGLAVPEAPESNMSAPKGAGDTPVPAP